MFAEAFFDPARMADSVIGEEAPFVPSAFAVPFSLACEAWLSHASNGAKHCLIVLR